MGDTNLLDDLSTSDLIQLAEVHLGSNSHLQQRERLLLQALARRVAAQEIEIKRAQSDHRMADVIITNLYKTIRTQIHRRHLPYMLVIAMEDWEDCHNDKGEYVGEGQGVVPLTAEPASDDRGRLPGAGKALQAGVVPPSGSDATDGREVD